MRRSKVYAYCIGDILGGINSKKLVYIPLEVLRVTVGR